jgi:uncharacterized cupin superfamily protein
MPEAIMKVDPATAPRDAAENGGLLVYLSEGGGLTQFGAYLDRLMPGAVSSQRHWHSAEDEMAFILSGTATLEDSRGERLVGPGDALCWPHGCPDAHHLINDGAEPCTYLIIGTRVAGDVCHYPDIGEKQVNGEAEWHLEDATGHMIEAGDLPPALRNLPPVWGRNFDPARPGERLLRDPAPGWQEESGDHHPILGPGPGPYRFRLLSDPGAITQFGAFIEELPPGSRSGHRHWHEAEDEMIVMLSGEVVLVEDTETPLVTGDVACWPAGAPVGHRLDNRGNMPARYLVIGTRAQRDRIHYTDHDLITEKDGAARRYLHRDGTPYGESK